MHAAQASTAFEGDSRSLSKSGLITELGNVTKTDAT